MDKIFNVEWGVIDDGGRFNLLSYRPAENENAAVCLVEECVNTYRSLAGWTVACYGLTGYVFSHDNENTGTKDVYLLRIVVHETFTLDDVRDLCELNIKERQKEK